MHTQGALQEESACSVIITEAFEEKQVWLLASYKDIRYNSPALSLVKDNKLFLLSSTESSVWKSFLKQDFFHMQRFETF